MLNVISESLIKVFREFGFIGVITYVAGLVTLLSLLWVSDFERQILFGVIGIFLFILASFIAYFRIKAQKDREKALIEMVQNSSNRLAEKLNENIQRDQVVSITQTIWQNQKDLIETILKGDAKTNKDEKNDS